MGTRGLDGCALLCSMESHSPMHDPMESQRAALTKALSRKLGDTIVQELQVLV